MLCGTLPFEDDPNNQESENMMLLYKYIMESTLSFPVNLTHGAINLVNRMLERDPKNRATIAEIQKHEYYGLMRWLKPFRSIFSDDSLSDSMQLEVATPDAQDYNRVDLSEQESDFHVTSLDDSIDAIKLHSTDNSVSENVHSTVELATALEPVQELRDVLSNSEKPSQGSDGISLANISEKHISFGTVKMEPSYSNHEPKLSHMEAPRGSLQLVRNFPRDSFRERASRAQSLDVRPQVLINSVSKEDYEMYGKMLKYHRGPIDQRALSSISPDLLIEQVNKILDALGLVYSISPSDPYKVEVKKIPIGNQLDPKNSRSSLKSVTTRPFRGFSTLIQSFRYISMFGLQYNRGYDGTKKLYSPALDPRYIKADTFVQFNVMVHKIDNLPGLFIVDLKRIRGEIWEFKRLYEKIIEGLNDTEEY